MGHDHHHDHTVSSLNKAFILGITLNVAFVVVEFAVGLYYGSMGLLSDAGHNLSDVASLLLAMLGGRTIYFLSLVTALQLSLIHI